MKADEFGGGEQFVVRRSEVYKLLAEACLPRFPGHPEGTTVLGPALTGLAEMWLADRRRAVRVSHLAGRPELMDQRAQVVVDTLRFLAQGGWVEGQDNQEWLIEVAEQIGAWRIVG